MADKQRDDVPGVQGAEGVQNLSAVHENVVGRGVDCEGDPGGRRGDGNPDRLTSRREKVKRVIGRAVPAGSACGRNAFPALHTVGMSLGKKRPGRIAPARHPLTVTGRNVLPAWPWRHWQADHERGAERRVDIEEFRQRGIGGKKRAIANQTRISFE